MTKTITALMLICCCLIPGALSSCNEKPKNPVSEYGDNLINSYKGAQNASEQANLDAVQKTVNAYRAAYDGYPKSLQDIESMLRGSVDLAKYDYDSATGTVTLKPKQ